MSVENTPVDVSTNEVEFTDEQVDKYFESRGAVAPDVQPETQAQPEKKEEKQEEKEVEVKEKIEKVVPYGALHEEREKRKELQRELQANAEKTRRLEEAWERLQAQGLPAAKESPNFNDDPIEALRHEQEELKKRTDATNEYLRQQNHQAQMQQAQMEFVNKYAQSANAYKQENPDFQPAYGFLVESTKAELRAAGYNEDEVARALVIREAEVVAKAYQDGVNPAERIYNLAKSRGYFKSTTAPSQDVSNAQQKLEATKKGMELSKSLDGGVPPSGKMTLEQLASLDDDEEFLKEFKKMHKRKF
jgi:hypothetical protein